MTDITTASVKFRNPDMFWDIAADLYFPADFDEGKTYPTVVSAHPIGSCKEQTSVNIYAKANAEAAEQVSEIDVIEAYEYYRTGRGESENGCVLFEAAHAATALGWDAFHLADQPLAPERLRRRRASRASGWRP